MTKKIGIIGAGIIGATTAFYLSQENVDITVFDDSVGQATSAAAGIISPWLSQRRNMEWYFLAKEGAKFYPSLIADLNQNTNTEAIYQQTGTLLYKKNDLLLKKLQALAEKRLIEAPEIGDISLVDYSESQKLIKDLSHTEKALYITGGAKVDGAGLVQALLAEVRQQGQSIIQEKIQWIKRTKSGWEVTDGKTIYTFDKLILACGAWIGELLTPLGFSVDVRPQKGQLVEIQTDLNTTDWPVIMPVGEADIIPFDNGKILVGATHENDQDFDLTPDVELLNQLKKEAELIIQALGTEYITKVRVGTRAYTSDFSPFFGEITDLPNLLVASGLGSSGLTTGPVIGKTLADWALSKDTKFEDYRFKPNQYIFPNK